MKQTKTIFLLFLALAITMSSCKKDDPEPDPEPTKKEILTDGMWTGISIKSYVDGVLDETTSTTSWKFDFKTDGSLDFYISSILYETGTWSFDSNDTVIIAYLEGETMLWDITTLNNNSLVFSYVGDTWEDLYTFER